MSFINSVKNMFSNKNSWTPSGYEKMNLQQKMDYYRSNYQNDKVSKFQFTTELLVFESCKSLNMFEESDGYEMPRFNDQGFFDILYNDVFNIEQILKSEGENRQKLSFYMAQQCFYLGMIAILQEEQTLQNIFNADERTFRYMFGKISTFSPAGVMLQGQPQSTGEMLKGCVGRLPLPIYKTLSKELNDEEKFHDFFKAFYIVGARFGMDLRKVNEKIDKEKRMKKNK